jgi:hypothetical protein
LLLLILIVVPFVAGSLVGLIVGVVGIRAEGIGSIFLALVVLAETVGLLVLLYERGQDAFVIVFGFVVLEVTVVAVLLFSYAMSADLARRFWRKL